jgi:O-antigen/teichoic acid export membrane protein
MRFGTLTLIDLAAQSAGVGVAVAVTLWGGGYWALVAQQVVASAVTLSVLPLGGWIPEPRVRWSEARPFLTFGADMAGCNLMSYLSKNLDNLLIGCCWGPVALGLYSRTYSILMLPITQINAPIAAIAIPALSRVRGNAVEFSKYYLRFVGVLVALTSPACFVMWYFAPEVVLVVLGEKWLAAIPLLRQLAIASLVLPVWYACGWLFASMGRTRQYLRLWVILASSLTIAFLLGVPRGALGVAQAYAIAMWLLVVLFLAVALQGSRVNLVGLARVIASPLIACLGGFVLVVKLDTFLAGRSVPLVRLVAGAAILSASSGLSLLFNRSYLGIHRRAKARLPTRPARAAELKVDHARTT